MATDSGAATSEAMPGAALLDEVVRKAQGRAADRVRILRATYPKEARRALAERLVTTFARRAGLGGAATGALSLVSLPIGLPAGIALTLALEAELLLSLLELYGLEGTGERGKLRMYALWAGGGLADAAKSVGMKAGAEAIGRVLAGSLPARLIAKLNPVLVRAVLRRIGMGWLPRALKFWPVLGAPIGYVVDSSALRTLGRASIASLESMPATPVAAEDEDLA
jgi:hypothetical protein